MDLVSWRQVRHFPCIYGLETIKNMEIRVDLSEIHVIIGLNIHF